MKEEPKITGRQYPYRGWRAIPLGFSMQKVLLASTQCSASLRRYRPLRSETERQFRWESTQYSFLKMEKWRNGEPGVIAILLEKKCTFSHTISDPSTFPPGKQGQGETQSAFLQWGNRRCKNVCYSSWCHLTTGNSGATLHTRILALLASCSKRHLPQAMFQALEEQGSRSESDQWVSWTTV